MKTNDVFPGKFLKGEDLGGVDVPVVIRLIAKEVMRDQDGRDVEKPVAYFDGGLKPLVLNVTNWKFLAAEYGDESDNWGGAKVVLTTVRTEAFGKIVDAVRFVKSARAAQPTLNEVNQALGEAEVAG